MTEQKDTDQLQLDPNSTWAESVAQFEREGAAWLTPADAPQLMALRSIAKELDGGKFQAALISQFTLIHRALLNKRPGEPEPAGAGDGPKPGGMAGGMFELFGGVWTADQ